jgi:hypothetical protein
VATPGTLEYPAALDDDVSLFEDIGRSLATTISSALALGGTTATVVDTTGFSTTGVAVIGDEVVYYTGKSGTTLTGLVRAREGTSQPGSHGIGVEVKQLLTEGPRRILREAVQALETKLGIGAGAPEFTSPHGGVLVGLTGGGSKWTAVADLSWDDTNKVLKHSIGGADPLAPPNQVTPIRVQHGVAGSYADSSTGNLFQLASWLENTGTRSSVAVFGEGKGSGSGSKTWGGNFVSYVNHATGSDAIGCELNYGKLVASTGGAYGLVIAAAGGNGASGHIQLQANDAASVPTFGIKFNGATQKPASGAFIIASGANMGTHGIDFSGVTFTTAGAHLGANALLAGATTLTGLLTVTRTADGDEMVKFNNDRPWSIFTRGTGATAELDLRSSNAGKTFRVTNLDGENVIYILAGSAAGANNRVDFCEARFSIADSGSVTIADGASIIVGSTNGLKIGTAITQKLGFFNATPVVQSAAYTVTNVTTDRTYNANSYTMDEIADVLGTLITDLKALGLIG